MSIKSDADRNSGKSSLLAAICRLLELDTGRILIDGVDISTVPCEFLRTRVTALPQDAISLPGTVRFNVFPPDDCSDADIITALQKVGLWDAVHERGGLDADMGTLSLSHGQRQLFRIACATLRKRPLLLLDETTSSLDEETDAKTKALIWEEFRHATVVIVAHRLTTIMDCDQIVMMERGSVVETGAPQKLSQGPSRLRQMWDSQR